MKKDKDVKAKDEKDIEILNPQQEIAVKSPDLGIIVRANEICEGWVNDQKQKTIFDYPAIITCDWHIPHTSVEWSERLGRVALSRKGDNERFPNLAIVGDFLDEASQTKFLSIGPTFTLDQELQIGSVVLNQLLNYFERIYINLGNHDMNLLKDLGKKSESFFSREYAEILFGRMLDSSLINTRVFISNLKWSESRDGKWLICHPDNYSKKGGNVPVEISEIYMKNVIGGHGHHLGMQRTKNGLFWGIDGGGMFNEDSMLYKIANITTHPKFNNGFVLLNERGEARLYGDGLEFDENQ